MRSVVLLLLTVVLSLAAGALYAEPSQKKENRWESNIRRFEDADRRQFPPKQGVLFVGSSSIVRWDLREHFPDLPAINRGFGGSQVSDSVRYAERIVLPYEPKIIVFYAGDNDVAAGKSPEQVSADYKQFVAKVHDRLPQTRIVYVAIKPSIRRWNLVEKMRATNALIRATAEQDERLVFVDIDRPMIGDDGKPRSELLHTDGLHLSDEGYKLWSALVRPHLVVPSRE